MGDELGTMKGGGGAGSVQAWTSHNKMVDMGSNASMTSIDRFGQADDGRIIVGFKFRAILLKTALSFTFVGLSIWLIIEGLDETDFDMDADMFPFKVASCAVSFILLIGSLRETLITAIWFTVAEQDQQEESSILFDRGPVNKT